MFDSCPGTSRLRTPTLTIKKCPRCNEDIEIFSSDEKISISSLHLGHFLIVRVGVRKREVPGQLSNMNSSYSALRHFSYKLFERDLVMILLAPPYLITLIRYRAV